MPKKLNNHVCRCGTYLGDSLFAVIIGLGCWHLGKSCKWVKMPAFIPTDRLALNSVIQWAFFIHCIRAFDKMEFYYFYYILIHQIAWFFQTIYLYSFAHLFSVLLCHCFLQKTETQKLNVRINTTQRSLQEASQRPWSWHIGHWKVFIWKLLSVL